MLLLLGVHSEQGGFRKSQKIKKEKKKEKKKKSEDVGQSYQLWHLGQVTFLSNPQSLYC